MLRKKQPLKPPRTPMSSLPKERSVEIRVAMLRFIQDTHRHLCRINGDLTGSGLEETLETLEYLYNTGYLRFKKDVKVKRYGYRIWLYDDELMKYCDISRMKENFKKLEQEEEV